MTRARLFPAFFFGSGFAGLVYQVVWTRQAGLLLGNTTAAIGTVVAVFMGGLALGSALAGRWAARNAMQPARLLRAYAVLEAAIGALSLVLPFLFRAAEPLHHATYESPALFGLMRVTITAAIFLAPATLMGATLPILVQYFARESTGTARTAGRLYAINTAGAAAGTAAAGLALLPAIGLTGATLVAAAINLTIGAWAFSLARRDEPPIAPTTTPPDEQPPSLAIYVLYALSGFAALLFEVTWTRALTLAIGSTAYAFTLVLMAFIGGLAIGAALAARQVDRIADPGKLFAIVQILIAAMSIGLFLLLRDLPETLVNLYAVMQESFVGLKAVELVVICMFVLVPTILMGTLLPISCRIAAGAQSSGQAIGRLYAWNTVGCIAGSAVASFALIPHLGLDRTLRVGAIIGAVIGAIATVAFVASPKRLRLVGGAAVVIVAALVVPGWDAASMSLGAYVYGPAMERYAAQHHIDLSERIAKEPKPVAVFWDSYALVTIHRDQDRMAMRINGKIDASTSTVDQATQTLLGQIPMLLHPDPKSALVIGLGSGITLANVASHANVRVDCIELCPAVAQAAELFRDANDDVLHNPRVRLRINDARTHVQYARARYDVITAEPSNLWLSGMANLFTREYFVTARARLNDGGLMAQWLHAYSLPAEDFRAVVRTFMDVFPQTHIWETDPRGDYLLLGWTSEPRIDLDLLTRRLASLQTRPERQACGLADVVSFLGNLVSARPELREMCASAPAITDDHCWIEYTAPRALYRDERAKIVEFLDPARGAPAALFTGGDEPLRSAIERRMRARRLVARLAVRDANYAHAVGEAFSLAPDDPVADSVVTERLVEALQFANLLRADGKLTAALKMLEVVPANHRLGPQTALVRVRLLAQLGRVAEARAALTGVPAGPEVDELLRELDAPRK